MKERSIFGRFNFVPQETTHYKEKKWNANETTTKKETHKKI